MAPTGADREAVEAEGGVVHAVDAAGEVGAFDASELGRLGGGRLETIEGREDRERPEREELALPSVEPGGRGVRVREAGCGHVGEMLGGVIEVGEVPDPDRAVGQDQRRAEDGKAAAGDAALPALDL